MADKKITELNSLVTPVGDDVFAIVDIDANETKKTTYADLTASLQQDIVNPSTGSLLVTSSLSASIMTFEKGDSSTYNIDLGDSFITPSQTGSFINNTYGLFNQTGSSILITGSTAEENLLDGGIGTLSVPANSFKKGDAYHGILTGHCTFQNNDTLRIRIKSDGVLLADTEAITIAGATDKRWKMEVYFSINETGSAGTASISTAGTFMYTKDAATTFEGTNFGLVNSGSFDTTIDNTLEITAQFSAGNNSIYSQIFTLGKTF